MTDGSRTLELIHADLDGTLTAAEKAELARQLLQDPEARRLHAELRQTDALLKGIPAKPPPAGLRAAILAALGLSGRATAPVESSSSGWARYRIAAAVLGGLVVVGLGYQLSQNQQDTGSLQGSVIQAYTDEQVLDAGDARVIALLYRSGEVTRLELRLEGPGEVGIVGQYDPAALTPREPAATGGNGSPGQFDVPLAPSAGRQTLEFTGTGPIRLEIHSGGRVLDAATLRSAPAD